MKAISPALPMTAPPRPSNADASAADEAFSALIAAVIGPPVAPSTPSAPSAPSAAPSASSRPSTRVEMADDARPAAATSPSTQTAQESAGSTADQSVSTKSSGPTKPSDGAASATAPASAASLAKQLKPDSTPAASAPNAASALTPHDHPKVPAGLGKAAAALAQALAAPTGEAARAALAKGVPADLSPDAQPTLKPGTALTEGQLPAQLVVAVTAAQAQANAATASSGPDAKPGDKSAGKSADKSADKAGAADDKKPTQIAPPAAPNADRLPAVSATATTLTPQAAQPAASSDSIARPTGGSTGGSTTSNHAKAADVKPAAHDQGSQGVAPHFEAQLTAQAPLQTTQPTPASPAQQPQPALPSGMVPQQIVQVVAPLRSAKDGDYTLSLQLHPADLGAVTVRVEVQQGVLSVHLSAEHAHGHEALNQSLADLRTQLQTSGVRTGDIVVAAKSPVMPQHQEQQQHTGGRHPQEAPMYDDAGADRRPGDRQSQHAQSQADDDTLDVRI